MADDPTIEVDDPEGGPEDTVEPVEVNYGGSN